MQSLSELKAQNREDEEKAQAAEAAQEIQEQEEVEEPESEIAELEDGESSEEPTEEAKELWLEEDNSVEPMFKSSDIKAAKTKLRAKLERKHNEETESLRQEIEQLKASITQPQNRSELSPRPRAGDYDTDEAYEAALDDWYDRKLESRESKRDKRLAQESKVREFRQKVESSVNQHYERAEKLLQDHNIDASLYQQSDKNVRQMVENIIPGKGDAVVDQLISNLGEGSEKVLYYIGKNVNALNELQAALVADPNGIGAAVLMGQMKAKVTMPAKRQSKAPKPAAQLKGDESVAESGKDLRKKYQAAHKSGDRSAAFSYRRQAKKAGVDVSNWS